MKLLAVFLTVFSLHAGAIGQGNITLSVKDMPAKQVFKELKKQTNLRFVYTDDLLTKLGRVSVSVKNADINEVLRTLLNGLPYTYKMMENNVVVIVKKEEILARDNQETKPLITVQGKIVNENEEPVTGASIRVKGTDKGTSTNDKGEFILPDIEENATLIISGTNIESVEVKINNKTDLATVRVKTRITVGEQVIISTGYDKTSKERFVGSYSQLDSAAYSRRAGMGIIERLDGTVTGILFDKKTSGPGLLATIQIRGISTLGEFLTASKIPLIIVDNFPFRQNLGTLNPDDILNITVLKDAAATSIWGAQAGNGVIVITTKRGKYNQPMQLSVSSNLTVGEKPDLYYYPQMSIPDFIDLELFLFNKGKYNGDLANTSSWPAISPVVELLAKRRAGKIPAEDSASQINAMKGLDLRNDLGKYVYRPSVSQQHYINLSGGNELFNYSFSAGYMRKLNDIQNSKPDDQFTLNSNLGFRPVNNLEITSGIYYSVSTQKSADFSLPAIYPYAQLADAYGLPLALPVGRRLAYLDTVGGGKLLDWRYRPLEEPGLTDRTDITRYIALNMNISYRFTTWMKAELSYQYSNQSDNGRNYNDTRTYFTRDLVNQYTNLSQINPDLRNPVPVGAILDLSNNQSISQNARARLNFNKNFGIKHQLTAFIGTEVSETRSANGNTNRFYGYNKETGAYKSSIDYMTNFLLFGGASGKQQVPNESKPIPGTNTRFVSFLGNASYIYNNRYTIYASARKDGANVFGVNTNRKWKPLWSAGASWDISKEESFYRIKWMPSLRLRASYGYSGNPSNASGFATISYSGIPAEYTNLVIANPGDAPNPDLRWEKVGMINTGLDFSLFRNRLSGSIDVWHKKVTDVISSYPFAPSTGILSFYVNAANLEGNGFEISLNSKNIIGDFQWQSSFGLSHAKMIVTKLFDRPRSARDFVGYAINAAEGKIAYGIASFRWAGLDPLTGDPQGYLEGHVSKNYGAIFLDKVGNQVFHGSAIPLYSGNIGNSFSWKNFSLSANISFRLDFYFHKPTVNYSGLINSGQGHADYALRWQQPGDEKYTNVPSLGYPTNSVRDEFYQYAEINVLRGDNIRLQDLRLQYTWNKNDLKKIPFKNLSAFVYVNNLNMILWRKNSSGLDPDFTGGNAFIIPPAKTWTGGVNLNF